MNIFGKYKSVNNLETYCHIECNSNTDPSPVRFLRKWNVKFNFLHLVIKISGWREVCGSKNN